jgi:hypothetical protein
MGAKPDIKELFHCYGRSEETENNFETMLSEFRQDFLIQYIEERQAAEEAAINRFLAKEE